MSYATQQLSFSPGPSHTLIEGNNLVLKVVNSCRWWKSVSKENKASSKGIWRAGNKRNLFFPTTDALLEWHCRFSCVKNRSNTIVSALFPQKSNFCKPPSPPPKKKEWERNEECSCWNTCMEYFSDLQSFRAVRIFVNWSFKIQRQKLLV